MAVVTLNTSIQAPVERVFHLSRSIDLHTLSTSHTAEKAIAGRTSGLICLGEQVTWEARHLGKLRQHTSLITAMEPPNFFKDEMIRGDFRYFRHQHHFQAQPGGTLMTDVLAFSSPYGWLGKLVDAVFMKAYLTRFLMVRNALIRQSAESDQWKAYLGATEPA